MKRLMVATLAAVLAAFSLMPGILSTPASAATMNVDVDDNFYAPSSITINVGDTVQWNFVGTLPHTVSANDASFDSGAPQTSGTFSFTFNTAGTFDYICGVHGAAMSGSVAVQQQEQPTNTPVPPSATPEPDETADPTNTPAPGTPPPNTPAAGTPAPGTTATAVAPPSGASATPSGGAGGLPSAGGGGSGDGMSLTWVATVAAMSALLGGGALLLARRRA